MPPQFRTLSFGIEDSKRNGVPQKRTSQQGKSQKRQEAEIDFAGIDFHTKPVDELLARFSSSRQSGLTNGEATSRLASVGYNAPSPPPSRWFRKLLVYLFGGFGSILLTAAILVFIAWKPLGNPPALANLALAIVLVIVWVVQASFNFWQDWSSSKVMGKYRVKSSPRRAFAQSYGSC